MAKFFVKTDPVDLQDGRIIITGTDVKHITNVLRASKGDALVLCDGAGMDYDAVIENISRDSIETVVTDARPSIEEPPIGVTLFQGIPKADKMEYIIQKCVELGIRMIVPVITARTVVRFGSARDAAAKTDRWNRIALEAAKQCGRGIIPKVSDPVRMDEALQLAGNHSLKLLPYEECREGSLREMLRKHHTAGETETHDSGIAVFIGPEGGFDSSEAEKAMDSGFIPVTLGPRILRTETAGVAVTAMIMYELGDMGGPRDK